MRWLIIGDPHLQIGKIEEARTFCNEIIELIKEYQYEKVVFLGDLFHTFALVRSEILDLWNQTFISIGDKRCILIVGNHDMSSMSGEGSHALKVFENNPGVCQVVDVHSIIDGIHFLPFIRDNSKFEEIVSNIKSGILFCHQSFNGAQFENGFYDPHGANPDSVKHLEAVIVGHCHKRQKLGNIWYPGTPFQHSFAEAGDEKYVYEFNIMPMGYSVSRSWALGLPTHFNVEFDKISDIIIPEPQTNGRYKFTAQGTPAEIEAFWKRPDVIEFRSQVLSVVDNFTLIKPVSEFAEISKETSPEKRFQEYINIRQWRTSKEDVERESKRYFRTS